METGEPEISVIIPTLHRSRLVTDAIASVLAQTFSNLELLVVVDGPDPPTHAALASVTDPRLRILSLPSHVGAAGARNHGVENARGQWIAFLDDDDTWSPKKLAMQLQTARAATIPYPIVACRTLARTHRAEHRWPRRYPTAGESMGEYLFCRHSFFFGEGTIPTSTWFVSRELLTQHPFESKLRAMEDLDWILRVTQDPRVQVLFVPTDEPLVVWNIEAGRERLSGTTGWQSKLAWAKARRAWLTPRAYAGLLLNDIGQTAARQGSWRGLFELPVEAWCGGEPSIQELATYCGYWLVPDRLARRLAGWFARLHGQWHP
jgi:glycosyltransferase involved in cell wall biosynthesis